MDFDQIEDCFPGGDGAVSQDDGRLGVTAQWLHDFARNVAAAEREECAAIADDMLGCEADRIAQTIRMRSD